MSSETGIIHGKGQTVLRRKGPINEGKRKKRTSDSYLMEKIPKKKASINIKLVTAGKKKKKFVFPALPEKITCKSAAKYQSFDILSKGTVKIPKGTEVKEVSWEGEFFGKSKKKEAIVKKSAWKKPSACVKTLENYMKKGTVLNLIVTGIGINLDVTISSFQTVNYGAYGNVRYSITFVEKRPLKIYTTKEKKKTRKKKTKSRNEADQTQESADSSYTVKQNDTLWKISQEHYGSGAQWTRIYDANAGTIEEAARRNGKSSSDHGHWIYAGTTLTIPA